jgi:PAP2 superfamily
MKLVTAALYDVIGGKRPGAARALCQGLIVSGFLSWTGPVGADAVTDWNEITMAAVTASRPGPVGMLDVALVQVAVHDAVQAIDKRFEPYHVEIRGATGSRSAAVAAAARDVLAGMYPDPAKVAALDATYYNYLAQNGLTNDPGLIAGQKAAAGILPLRRLAPDPLPLPFIGGTDPGVWRPTDSFQGTPPAPPPFSPMVTPWLANVDPFTLTSPTRFRAEPPPALTSERYRRDYEEVKALGAFAGSTRTPEQTDVAYFYSENFFTQWNRALRTIALQRVHRVGDSARLFALANMATADALISSWDSKKFYNVWRPLTAIQEGDNDGNPQTMGDPTWQPLINTPNYPDYTSGANNLAGAMTRTLALFFGTDKVPFEVTSVAPLAVQKTRVYRRFSDAAQDVVNARIYLGIHFRFADTAARTQGRRVADWTFNHFLLPLDNDDHHRQGDEQ